MIYDYLQHVIFLQTNPKDYKKNVDLKFQIKRFHSISNMTAPMLTALDNIKSTLYYPCTGLLTVVLERGSTPCGPI